MSAFGDDPRALVIACRRMAQHHPDSGALVFLAARAIKALDPTNEVWEAAGELLDDRTADVVAGALDPGDTVLVIDWPAEIAHGLLKRPDVSVLCVDTTGAGSDLAEHLRSYGHQAEAMVPAGMGPAVAEVNHVMIEARSSCRVGVLAPAGAMAAASIANANDTVANVVVPRGRSMTRVMWEAMADRAVPADTVPWQAPYERITPYLFERFMSPGGLLRGHTSEVPTDCPDAPELFTGL